MPEVKKCLMCGRSVKGRSDKKFCSGPCRSSYNNQLRSDSHSYIRYLNDQLKENHRILERIYNGFQKATTVSRELMLRLDFHFKYHTHTYTTRKGAVYYFCYDYGYLPLDTGGYLIVKERKDNTPLFHSPINNGTGKTIFKGKMPERIKL